MIDKACPSRATTERESIHNTPAEHHKAKRLERDALSRRRRNTPSRNNVMQTAVLEAHEQDLGL